MYDINLKNVKKGKNIYYTFLIVGILVFIALTAIYVSIKIKFHSLDSNIISTNVVVNSYTNDEGRIMYRPTYYFEVDNKEYECSSALSSSKHPGTENKIVYYDSKNPYDCMSEDSILDNNFLLIFYILPIVFISLGAILIRNINKRIKIINELNKNGKLIKNLPYRLENTNVSINGIAIKRLVIDYTLNNGTVITLRGDGRFDKKHFDHDGMVDLLIDENNTENYYIDFEINRLTGNRPEDYYDLNKNQIL